MVWRLLCAFLALLTACVYWFMVRRQARTLDPKSPVNSLSLKSQTNKSNVPFAGPTENVELTVMDERERTNARMIRAMHRLLFLRVLYCVLMTSGFEIFIYVCYPPLVYLYQTTSLSLILIQFTLNTIIGDFQLITISGAVVAWMRILSYIITLDGNFALQGDSISLMDKMVTVARTVVMVLTAQAACTSTSYWACLFARLSFFLRYNVMNPHEAVEAENNAENKEEDDNDIRSYQIHRGKSIGVFSTYTKSRASAKSSVSLHSDSKTPISKWRQYFFVTDKRSHDLNVEFAWRCYMARHCVFAFAVTSFLLTVTMSVTSFMSIPDNLTSATWSTSPLGNRLIVPGILFVISLSGTLAVSRLNIKPASAPLWAPSLLHAIVVLVFVLQTVTFFLGKVYFSNDAGFGTWLNLYLTINLAVTSIVGLHFRHVSIVLVSVTAACTFHGLVLSGSGVSSILLLALFVVLSLNCGQGSRTLEQQIRSFFIARLKHDNRDNLQSRRHKKSTQSLRTLN